MQAPRPGGGANVPRVRRATLSEPRLCVRRPSTRTMAAKQASTQAFEIVIDEDGRMVVRERASSRWLFIMLYLLGGTGLCLFILFNPGLGEWQFNGQPVKNRWIVWLLDQAALVAGVLIDGALFARGIHLLLRSQERFVLDAKAGAVSAVGGPARPLGEVAAVRLLPGGDWTRVALLLATGESLPPRGVILGPSADAAPIARRMAEYLGVPFEEFVAAEPAGPRRPSGVGVEATADRLVLADTTDRITRVLELVRSAAILGGLGYAWASLAPQVAAMARNPADVWWLLVPFALLLLLATVLLVIVARRIPRRLRRAILGGDTFTLDRASNRLLRDGRSLGALDEIRAVCLVGRPAVKRPLAPAESKLVLAMSGGQRLEVVAWRTNLGAMEVLAGEVAAFVGRDLETATDRSGRFHIGGFWVEEM